MPSLNEIFGAIAGGVAGTGPVGGLGAFMFHPLGLDQAVIQVSELFPGIALAGAYYEVHDLDGFYRKESECRAGRPKFVQPC